MGSCHFIAAICSCASFSDRFATEKKKNPSLTDVFSENPDPISRLFVAADTQRGVFGILYFAFGSWEFVIIDDTIACDEDGDALYVFHGEENAEQWPMLLEKAKAKSQLNYDSFDGGLAGHSITDLTAGVEMKVDLQKLKWAQLKKLGENPNIIIGCGLRRGIEEEDDGSGEVGACGEAISSTGLAGGHAYSVLAVKETSDGKGFFVCIRNPWGSGEWTGNWSDDSPLWKKFPKYAKELNFKKKEDGVFWMSAADFRKYMDIDVVQIFEDRSQILTISRGGYGNAKPADDIFMLKVDSPCKIRFVIGQYQSRYCETLLGSSEENHKIVKGADWNDTSDQLGLAVYHHKNVCPLPNNYSSSSKKLLGRRSDYWQENMFVDVENVPAGFVSIQPLNVCQGTPYYIRVVVVNDDAKVTFFTLSKGLKGAVGFTDGVKIKVQKPKPKPPVEENNTEQTATTSGGEEQEFEYEDWDDDDADWYNEEGEDDDDENDDNEYDFSSDDDDDEDWDDEWYSGDGDDEDMWNDCDWEEMDAQEWGSSDEEDFSDFDDDDENDDEEEEVSDEDLREMFDSYDDSCDGFLDKGELTALLLSNFGDLSPRVIVKVMRSADTNGDGKISFDEFKDLAREMFSLDPDEIEDLYS